MIDCCLVDYKNLDINTYPVIPVYKDKPQANNIAQAPLD